MERSYLNAVIGMIAVFIFGIFLILRPTESSFNQQKMEEIFVVNMPRPVKEFLMGFSLEGRRVLREMEDMNVGAAPAAKTGLAKKDAKNGTKAQADKKKTPEEKAKEAQRRQAYLQKQAQERAFRVRIIQESERYRKDLVRRELEKLQKESYEIEQYAAQFKDSNKAPEKFEADAQEEKEKMTAAQWKSLILSSPTKENVQKMVEAFHKKEIDLDPYLQIVETLIRDNSEEKKKLGVWALSASLSVESFTLAVKAQSVVNSALQKTLKDYLFSYNRPQGLGFLDAALKSTESDVRTVAAEMITKAVDAIKAGQPVFSSSTGRGSRGESSSSISLNSYRRLVPTLQWLVSNPNSGLTQWAQTLLSQLQSTSTPA